MTLKEPKQKTIHKPIGAVIEAGKRNILYLLVFTCHYLYQLSNEISSLVRLANQINVMAWISQFWPDRLSDFEFRLLFSALELTVHIALASNKEDQMEETSMWECVAQKTEQISRTRDFYHTC